MIMKKSLFIFAGYILIRNKNCVNGIDSIVFMVVEEILFRVVPPFVTQLVCVLIDACRSIDKDFITNRSPDDIC